MRLPSGQSWLGYGLLLLAGAAMALALPPWHVLPALLLFALLDRDDVGIGGFWLFAFGFHLVGLYWITEAFGQEPERFGALAVPGVVALSAILATIAAVSLWATGWVIDRRGETRPLALAVAWILAELLRGPWGTQFPWNPISLVWSASDVTMQPIAWLGSEMFGFLTLVAALLVGRAIAQRQFQLGLAATAIVAAFVLIGWFRLPAEPTAASGPMLQIVQANIGQHHKWDPEKRRQWFFKHVELSSREDGGADILIWPESSVPYALETTEDARALVVQSLPDHGIALVGSDFVDRSREPILLHNSVYALDRSGEILTRYDKVNLVPFGEFLPFRNLLAPVGLEALAVGSVDFTPGEGRHLLQLPGLPSPSPLVCYEAAFAGLAAPVGERPEWLLNVTNDAWFGNSAGPYQHVNMARMRAIETGLPLVRAANTGISVVTDAYGRVLAELPLGERGVIRHRLPQALPASPPAGKHPAIPWLGFFAVAGLCRIGLLQRQKRMAQRQ